MEDGDSRRRRILQILKVAVPLAAAIGAAAYALGYFTPTSTTKQKSETTSADSQPATADDDNKDGPVKPMDLATVSSPFLTPFILFDAQASRDDVIGLLNCVIEVQKILSKLMDETITKVLSEDLTMAQTYNEILHKQPADPLDAHGLSIADFDALLNRFNNDAGELS